MLGIAAKPADRPEMVLAAVDIAAVTGGVAASAGEAAKAPVDTAPPQRPPRPPRPNEPVDTPFGDQNITEDFLVDPPYPSFVGDLADTTPPDPPERSAVVMRKPQGVVAQPKAGNVVRRGGMMIGGGPVPEQAPEVHDPWAVPAHRTKPGTKKIKVGATFTFGAKPKPDDGEKK